MIYHFCLDTQYKNVVTGSDGPGGTIDSTHILHIPFPLMNYNVIHVKCLLPKKTPSHVPTWVMM